MNIGSDKMMNMEEMPPPQEQAPQYGSAGTILEAAFVDSAYDWPPPEGIGKNAIELQASVIVLVNVKSNYSGIDLSGVGCSQVCRDIV